MTYYIGSDGYSVLSSSPSPSVTTPWTLASDGRVFVVQNGPIHILQLVSVCITTCDFLDVRLQWKYYREEDQLLFYITGFSPSLANCAAGTAVSFTFDLSGGAPGALTPGVLVPNSVYVPTTDQGIIVPPGKLLTVVDGAGNTSGTWRHFMRWQPLAETSDVRMPTDQEIGL